MLCFKITDIKRFMATLFTGPVLDSMPVEEVHIVTATTFDINGRIVPAFYTAEEIADMPDGLPEYILWEQLRPTCFSLIKGKKTPVSFQITLHAPNTLLKELCSHESCSVAYEKVGALVFTIRYAEGTCRIITGSSYQSFLPDKSLDKLWDDYFRQFLSNLEIHFEEE